MRKQILTIATALTLFGSMAASAQQLPQGKWWRRSELVQALSLTEEQQAKLEGVFRGAASELIDLRADVEKQMVALRGELDQPQLNRANIQRNAARLNEARGRLFERELMMLVDMRGVLSETQWNRMRTELESMRPKPPMRGDDRPMPPNRRPMPARPGRPGR
ncbi:MAG TPA: periplasmic heavy metal sensor [Thermoanaerobaculia bacterium]|nr:periplasmic heavy metal sensor [Thermoanaerobaculia bacterium]